MRAPSRVALVVLCGSLLAPSLLDAPVLFFRVGHAPPLFILDGDPFRLVLGRPIDARESDRVADGRSDASLYDGSVHAALLPVAWSGAFVDSLGAGLTAHGSGLSHVSAWAAATDGSGANDANRAYGRGSLGAALRWMDAVGSVVAGGRFPRPETVGETSATIDGPGVALAIASGAGTTRSTAYRQEATRIALVGQGGSVPYGAVVPLETLVVDRLSAPGVVSGGTQIAGGPVTTVTTPSASDDNPSPDAASVPPVAAQVIAEPHMLALIALAILALLGVCSRRDAHRRRSPASRP